jgi:hypothetical protein
MWSNDTGLHAVRMVAWILQRFFDSLLMLSFAQDSPGFSLDFLRILFYSPGFSWIQLGFSRILQYFHWILPGFLTRKNTEWSIFRVAKNVGLPILTMQ